MRDPWRVVDPLRPEPIERPKGKISRPEDVDIDADMHPTRPCILRFRSCSLEIAGKELKKPEDALARLARCIAALKKATATLPRAQRLLGSVHVVIGDNVSDAPPKDVPAATLACGRHVIAFSGMTLDQGTLMLARALMAAGRDARLAPILRTNGVTPMLRTT